MTKRHFPLLSFRFLAVLVLILTAVIPVAAVAPRPEAPNSNFVFLPMLAKNPGHTDYVGKDVPIPALAVFEPHTAVINPLNPHNVVVGAGTNLMISVDFGATFPVGPVAPAVPPGLPAGYGFCGDDSLAFDAAGRLFWTYLICADFNNDGTRDDLSVVVQQVNPTTGALVGNAADVTPGNHIDDKSWIAADSDPTSPFSNNLYVIWTRFDGGSNIMFSRSINQAGAWSAERTISGAGEGFVWPSHLATAPNGDIYVGYHGDTCNAAAASMFILRDSSGGVNLAAGTAVQKTSFAAAVTCNRQSQPGTVANTDFWMQGAMQPFILPDPMKPGNVYVIANDDPNNDFTTGDPGDVILARSEDFGNTWSLRTISHAPLNTLQAFPTGAIDQDGNIMAFWYDTRRGQTNAGNNFLLDVYATVSRDGGLTWSNDFRINDNAFDPDLGAPCRFGPGANCGGADPVTTTRIGEYNGAAAANGIGYAAWTGNSGAGQQIEFDVFSILGYYPDAYEPNNAVNSGIVTDLGVQDTYNLPKLTIHSAMDEDFFKFTALYSGKLSFKLSTIGRVADLDIQLLDKYNPHTPPNVISTSSPALDANNDEVLSIPVVMGDTYYLRVFAQPGQAHPYNTYSLSVRNTPVPTPFGIGLALGSDSGRSDQDDVTNVPTATVHLRVDELWLEGLAFSPANGTPDLFDDDPGYKVAVYRNGNLSGYAQPLLGQPGALAFQFPLSAPLGEGINMVTARVFVVDPSENPDVAGIAHQVARGSESEAFRLTLDMTPPPAPSAPDLLAASDSGASDSDNVTSVNPPAFGGTAESNALIRIFANTELVGQGVTGSDATNGMLGDGLGYWEVTIEPLADGTYTMTAEAEDLAGNLSPLSAAMAPGLTLDTPDGGGIPQRPTLDLVDTFDTGRSDKDNITKLTTLDFRVSAEAGSTVLIKDGNTVIDTFVMPADAFTIRTLLLAEGPHPMSTESSDLAGNTSHQSMELHVTVDITPPVVPPAPDLQPASDTAGVNIDNITTDNTPTFEGTGEANAEVRLFASGILSGQGVITSYGVYQVSTSPLDDGVYAITATYEDLAGNLSAASDPLKVTIARTTLNLPGLTTGPANAGVVINLADGTITGYPGVPGGVIGVVGIPVVNLDVNSLGLTVLGSPWDDNLGYYPSGAESGTLLNNSNGQIFNFSAAALDFTIDAGAGNDTVTTFGTASSDTILVTVDTNTVVAVNGMKTLLMPTVKTEKAAVSSGQSVDYITVTVYDTVNGNVFIDAGEPANVSHSQDELTVVDGVGNGKFRNLSAGPVPGSGSMEVYFPFTTDAITRIDYVGVEKLRALH